MELATEIWKCCLQYKIMVQAQHIQGLHNTIADFESRRQFFKNQWKIKPYIFQQIHRTWGPFTIDLFADRTTKLLPYYLSWMPDPDALYTDVLSIPWNKISNSFLNPPGISFLRSCTRSDRNNFPW